MKSINISRDNPDTIVVSNNYSTGSYTTGPSTAIFEMASTTQGMLLPRMTRSQREAIRDMPEGLVVYDTTLHKICYYSLDTVPGWYSLNSTLIV